MSKEKQEEYSIVKNEKLKPKESIYFPKHGSIFIKSLKKN
jgi:hypothetical protein